MKIIAFTQLRNELSKGNLENWFKCTEPCDYRYIFDQNHPCIIAKGMSKLL